MHWKLGYRLPLPAISTRNRHAPDACVCKRGSRIVCRPFRAPESRALAISKNPNVSRVFEATKMYAGGSETQVTGGESTVTQDCSAFPHGTWVAEVLGGQTFGVAKDVTFVNYRVLKCDSTHPWASDADVAAALDAVVATHSSEEMAVVNLSLYSNTEILSVIDAAVSRVHGFAGTSWRFVNGQWHRHRRSNRVGRCGLERLKAGFVRRSICPGREYPR